MTTKLKPQSTYETCLAVSLLHLLGKDFSKEDELAILLHSLNFSKDCFTIGHLDFVANKFGALLDFHVENKQYFDLIRKIKFSKNINLLSNKIDLALIDKLLESSGVITHIDYFRFSRICHYPHFIIVFNKNKDKYEIFDPWNGKINLVNGRLLSKSIQSLRNLLKFSPQAIVIKSKPSPNASS